MITTKADKLIRSLIDAGLSLTDFTILATKVIRMQEDFKNDHQGRLERDRTRQKEKLREQTIFEQQLKTEEERRQKGLAKLRELGYVTADENYSMTKSLNEIFDPHSRNFLGNKEKKTSTDSMMSPYSKEINDIKQKQRECCLTFNIDYDLRLNQQVLERACKRAKRNIYELRADRFNRPEHRSILSVETATLHNKLKEAVREVNKIFLETKSTADRRHFQEFLSYINQYEGDIDLLMCQMQYEPKVKETILFAPVTSDILDRMNLMLHCVRTLAKEISAGSKLDEQNEVQNVNDSEMSNVPTKVAYIIKVKTNDHAGSSLSDETNVNIKLHGTHNKSPDIRLIQSINATKWQSGQIDLFNIELIYLGDIYAIELWHDSEYSSWKVDWIDVLDDAANIYRFPIDRLFDQNSNEKTARFIIQRDLGPVQRLPTKPMKQIKSYKQIGFSTYKVQVKTGKQANKATDASIFVQMKGENGTFADNLCSANSAFKGSVFEPDQLDTFYLVWPYLGKLNSLQLLIQSQGTNPSWFCEYVNVEDPQTQEQYKFIVNQLFDSSNPDDRNVKKHLTVYPEKTNQENSKKGSGKGKPSYLLKIKTGDKGLTKMSTIPPIKLTIRGEKDKSEPFELQTSDKKRTLFRENQSDEFLIPSNYYVGPVKAVRLAPEGPTDPWFIETMIVRDIAQGQDYVFPVYKWIDASNGANELTAQPIDERKPDYVVYTRTIASELKGPDRAIKLNIQGSKGNKEVELDHPVTMYNSFQPGRKDEYYLDNMKSLGELQAIEIDATHPNIKKLGLDYIEIQDRVTNNSYRFKVNRMLDAKNPKIAVKAETGTRSNTSLTKTSSSRTNQNSSIQHLAANTPSNISIKKSFDQLTTSIPQGTKRPTIKEPKDTELEVSIKTESSEMIQSEGDQGKSDKSPLRKPLSNAKNRLYQENIDVSSTQMPDVGKGKSGTPPTDGKSSDPFSTSSLEIKKNQSKKTSQAKNKAKYSVPNEFPVELNESSSDHEIQETSISEKDFYQIKLKTIKKEFLDRETKLQIELIDEQGQSEKQILEAMMNNVTGVDQGKIDTFLIETTTFLDKLKNVKLSLIESKSKKQDLYQAEYVEIFHPKSDKTYRIDYSKDEILNVDKNRLEINKSPKLLADLNAREKSQPQGSAPSSASKSPVRSSPYPKLTESLADDPSLSEQTLSKDLNSLSEKNPSSASRQIRPGDRVKSTGKRQSVDSGSNPSLHEADWYRRSIENSQDHQNQSKQIQLSSQQHVSQTKFQQQTAQIKKSNNEFQRKTDYQNKEPPKEKKVISASYSGPSLPKQNSSRSLKQQNVSTIDANNRFPAHIQQQFSELQAEMNEYRQPSSQSKSKTVTENLNTISDERMKNSPRAQITSKVNNDPNRYDSYSTAEINSSRGNERIQNNTANRIDSSIKDESHHTSSTTQKISLQNEPSFSKRSTSSTPVSSVNRPGTTISMSNSTVSTTSESKRDRDKEISTRSNTISYEQSKSSEILSPTKRISTESRMIDQSSPGSQSKMTSHESSISNLSRAQTIPIAPSSPKTEARTMASNIDNLPIKHSTSIGSKSVASSSRSQSDVTTQRSLSASPSSTPTHQDRFPSSSATSREASQPAVGNVSSHISQVSSKTTTYSTQMDKPSISTFSSSQGSNQQQTKSINNLKQSQQTDTITSDRNDDEFKASDHHQGVSAVSIHTIATKSDSDSNVIRRTPDSGGSEHSMRDLSLLSPEAAKLWRKNRRHGNRSKTSSNTTNEQTMSSHSSKSVPNTSTLDKGTNDSTVSKQNYLIREASDVQYAARPSPMATQTSDVDQQTNKPSHSTLSKESRSQTSESYTRNTTQSSTTNPSKATSRFISTHPSNATQRSTAGISTSTKTENSSVSVLGSIHPTSAGTSKIDSTSVSKSPSAMTKTTTATTTTRSSSNVSPKLSNIEHMSTVYEESEPSTGSASVLEATSRSEQKTREADEYTKAKTGLNSKDLLSSLSDQTTNLSNKPSSNRTAPSSIHSNLQPISEMNTQRPMNKSPKSSSHHQKTINAKSKPKLTTFEYELRIQTGNESQLDGTNEPVVVEVSDSQGHLIEVPLKNSVNNSKPFQKGQLDVFHFTVPNHFQSIKKLNLSLPRSNRDPLHIRYCELQDRHTMNTLYFPIETWLGKKNVYNVDMFINDNDES